MYGCFIARKHRHSVTEDGLRGRNRLSNNPNPVIAKGVMHLGRINIRHMTGDAVFLTYRTTAPWQVGKILGIFRSRVTVQTCFIVETRIGRQGLVGVVASHTSQSGVAILSPALTLLQPIGLHSEGLYSLGYSQDYIPKRAMTGPAEIRGIRWT